MNDARGESIVCTRVLIADDQPRARRSLKALLTAMRWSTPNHTEPATPPTSFPLRSSERQQDGQEAVEQVWALHPDVVQTDGSANAHGVRS